MWASLFQTVLCLCQWQAITIIGVTNIRLMHNFTKRATVILHQRKIHADFVNAAGGHVKWLPPAALKNDCVSKTLPVFA